MERVNITNGRRGEVGLLRAMMQRYKDHKPQQSLINSTNHGDENKHEEHRNPEIRVLHAAIMLLPPHE